MYEDAIANTALSLFIQRNASYITSGDDAYEIIG